MYSRFVGLSLAGLAAVVCATSLAGQGATREQQLVTRVAEALGGRERLLQLKTLRIVGYGELAYFNGGGNITADPQAPQKWQKVLDYARVIDLEHWRTRVQQRLKMDFEFASTAGPLGLNRTNETLSGDVAFKHFQSLQVGPQTFFGTGYLTQDLGDAFTRRGALVAARECCDVMSVFKKAVGEMAADESGDAGDKATPGHARAESSRQSLRRN